MEQKYCQSCGMPISEDLYGTELNNKKNQEYVFIVMKMVPS